MPGRILAIGDIHGCDVALETLLGLVKAGADDTVVLVGDIIDRGPGSCEVIDQLLELRETCRLVFIRGNHEQMMLEVLDGAKPLHTWLDYGGEEMLESYGGSFGDIPSEHIEFLRSSLDYWECEKSIFVHASLEPGVPLDRQTAEWLRWTRLTGFENQHPSRKRVICGHTSQKSGVPVLLDGWVCIDTYAYGHQYLTCLDTHKNLVYQADQSGNARGPVPLASIGRRYQ